MCIKQRGYRDNGNNNDYCFYIVVQIVLVLEGGCILLSGLLSCQVLTMWCASVAAAAMQARGGSAASGGSTGGSVAAAGGGVQIL